MSSTRSNWSSVSADPLGRERPGAEQPLGGAVGVGRAVGEDRLEVHRLPERARLDVGLGEVEPQIVGGSSPATVGVDEHRGEPEVVVVLACRGVGAVVAAEDGDAVDRSRTRSR